MARQVTPEPLSSVLPHAQGTRLNRVDCSFTPVDHAIDGYRVGPGEYIRVGGPQVLSQL